MVLLEANMNYDVIYPQQLSSDWVGQSPKCDLQHQACLVFCMHHMQYGKMFSITRNMDKYIPSIFRDKTEENCRLMVFNKEMADTRVSWHHVPS